MSRFNPRAGQSVCRAMFHGDSICTLSRCATTLSLTSRRRLADCAHQFTAVARTQVDLVAQAAAANCGGCCGLNGWQLASAAAGNFSFCVGVGL